MNESSQIIRGICHERMHSCLINMEAEAELKSEENESIMVRRRAKSLFYGCCLGEHLKQAVNKKKTQKNRASYSGINEDTSLC